MRSLKIAALAFTVCSSVGSFAQQNLTLEKDVNNFFKWNDKNKNGTLEAEEIKTKPLYKSFAKVDKNSDNKLSRDEVRATFKKWKKYKSTNSSVENKAVTSNLNPLLIKDINNYVKWNDANGNGFIEGEEIKGKDKNMYRNFSKIDKNSDNKLSKDELTQDFKKWWKKGPIMIKSETEDSGAVHPLLEKDVNNFIKWNDKDKNGFVEGEEIKQKPLYKNFKKIDKNSDGKLSKEELIKDFKRWKKYPAVAGSAKKDFKNKAKKKYNKKSYNKKPRFNYEKLTQKELFSRFDKNKNNKIEKSEATVKSLKVDFSKIDKNGDLELSKKEVKKYLKKNKK